MIQQVLHLQVNEAHVVLVFFLLLVRGLVQVDGDVLVDGAGELEAFAPEYAAAREDKNVARVKRRRVLRLASAKQPKK